MSIAPQIGRDSTITARGRTWNVGRMDVDVIDELVTWAGTRIPNPLTDLKPIITELGALAIPLVRELMDQRPKILSIDDPIVRDLIFGYSACPKCKARIPKPEPCVACSCGWTGAMQDLDHFGMEGRLRIMYALLKKNHPELTMQDVMEIGQEAGELVFSQAMEKAAGQPPPVKSEARTDGNYSAPRDWPDALAQDHPLSSVAVSSPSLGNPSPDAGGNPELHRAIGGRAAAA